MSQHSDVEYPMRPIEVQYSLQLEKHSFQPYFGRYNCHVMKGNRYFGERFYAMTKLTAKYNARRRIRKANQPVKPSKFIIKL